MNNERYMQFKKIDDNTSELLIYGDIRKKNLFEIFFGEEVDEGLFGSLVGGLTGATIGPAIGKAICNALGISSGMLYNLFTSRMFTTAVAAYIGYKN